jgi:hypothetical protein
MKIRYLTLSVVFASAVVFIVWCLLPDYYIQKYGGIERAGSYGDIFGSVNALFTSLAFALLIYTALMQHEELKLQREELKLTREEIAKSAKAQDELVKLTRDNNEFQKHLRRHDILPQVEIVEYLNSDGGVHDESNLRTRITLKPRFYAFRFIAAEIKNSRTVTLESNMLNNHYSGRLISIDQEVILSLFHDSMQDLIDLTIDLTFMDIDNENKYLQCLTFDGRSFIASDSSVMLRYP